MLPVVRHREVAFLLEPAPLHVAPVVIGAPDDAAGEPRFEGDGARTVVAAERDAVAGRSAWDRRRDCVSSQSTTRLAQCSASKTGRACRATAGPRRCPGWSMTSEDTPRFASQRGSPTRYCISFVESRPLTWTSMGALGRLTPSAAEYRAAMCLPSYGISTR